MSDKKKSGKIVFWIVLAVVLVCAAGSVFYSVKTAKDKNVHFHIVNEKSADKMPGLGGVFQLGKKNSQSLPSFSKEYVAQVYITGTIEEKNNTYNQKWLLDTIAALKKDEKNKGILLVINSPGGTVYHTDEVYLALLDYKRSGKPVYAYFENLAASGAYYIACAADKIIANRNTLTGSIGIIAGQSIDATGLLEKLGIKSVTITAGKNKNMGNYNQPLTDEQRAILQSIADEAYEQFTGIVSEGRKIPLEKVQALADGRIYSAKQALNNQLIDEIDTLINAQATLCNDQLDAKQLPFEELKYTRDESWYESILGPAGEFLPGELLHAKVPFPSFYYVQ